MVCKLIWYNPLFILYYFTTMFTSLPLITITLTIVFPSVAAKTASSAKASALIPSSFKSEATLILALILPLIWIAISISSLTRALASNSGQASVNT